jgi:hypothetical protein
MDDTEQPFSTGIPEIDAAMEWANPVPALVAYFDARWTRDGQDAVIRDMERCVEVFPPGSPAHDGMSGWLEEARKGKRPA